MEAAFQPREAFYLREGKLVIPLSASSLLVIWAAAVVALRASVVVALLVQMAASLAFEEQHAAPMVAASLAFGEPIAVAMVARSSLPPGSEDSRRRHQNLTEYSLCQHDA